jgi:hypothetical protein
VSEFDPDKDFEGSLDVDNSDIELNPLAPENLNF